MTSPALRALKTAVPGRRLSMLTSPSGAAAAALIPEIDEVLVYESPWMKATLPRDAGPDFAMISRLRERGFDGAVILTTYSQSPLPAALLLYMAGIPLRLAYCRENPYQLLTDWVKETEPAEGIRHEVERHVHLVAHVGCPAGNDRRLSVREDATAALTAQGVLEASGVRLDRPWVVAHPGSTAASRRYPPELFGAAVRQIVNAGVQVVLTGTASEASLVEEVRTAAGVPAVSLAGRLQLAELAEMLRAAPLLLSNNTGPVHLAAAVGTPVVVLYALTNPQHTPWQVPSRVLNHDVPCKYCYKSICPEGHHHCLTLVPPETVSRAVLDLLAEAAAPLPVPL